VLYISEQQLRRPHETHSSWLAIKRLQSEIDDSRDSGTFPPNTHDKAESNENDSSPNTLRRPAQQPPPYSLGHASDLPLHCRCQIRWASGHTDSWSRSFGLGRGHPRVRELFSEGAIGSGAGDSFAGLSGGGGEGRGGSIGGGGARAESRGGGGEGVSRMGGGGAGIACCWPALAASSWGRGDRCVGFLELSPSGVSAGVSDSPEMGDA